MLVKEVKPINFLYYRTETTIENLVHLIPMAKELYREAVEMNLHITGPIHWHYNGFSGDVTKPFRLEIALPVGDTLSDYDGKFHFKRSQPFKCVSIIHEGNWLDIPHTYAKLNQFVQKHKMEPSLMNREIYINSDFHQPEANVTEIQMGLT